MKEFIIDSNQANKRLDKYLRMLLPKANDSFIYKMLRKKNIKLNDSKALGSEKLQIGDKVKIYFTDDTFSQFAGDTESKFDEYTKAYEAYRNIKIVYEDNDIAVINKPSNLLSQKAKDDDISLNEWFVGYLIDSGFINLEELKSFRPSIVNRLDRNTSGLVIGAKTLKAEQVISQMIKDRTIRKFYSAQVIGQVKASGTYKGYLIKDEKTNKVKVYDNKPSSESAYIETSYEVKSINEETSVLEIELITGKTHQIRAHLAYLNHPIVGDNKYGNEQFNRKFKAKSQRLTAVRLEFPDECEIESLKGRIISL